MGAATGGRSTASDIQLVLSATRGVATGGRREYCVTDDGKGYVSMNTLRQYRTNVGRVSIPTAAALIDNGVGCWPRLECLGFVPFLDLSFGKTLSIICLPLGRWV